MSKIKENKRDRIPLTRVTKPLDDEVELSPSEEEEPFHSQGRIHPSSSRRVPSSSRSSKKSGSRSSPSKPEILIPHWMKMLKAISLNCVVSCGFYLYAHWHHLNLWILILAVLELVAFFISAILMICKKNKISCCCDSPDNLEIAILIVNGSISFLDTIRTEILNKQTS